MRQNAQSLIAEWDKNPVQSFESLLDLQEEEGAVIVQEPFDDVGGWAQIPCIPLIHHHNKSP